MKQYEVENGSGEEGTSGQRHTLHVIIVMYNVSDLVSDRGGTLEI